MGEYATELPKWVDPNGFVGRTLNPAPNEEGNPLLQNGIAIVIAHLRQDLNDSLAQWFEKSVRSLQVFPGIYNKKPGTKDEITRDDLYGVVAGSVHAGLNLHLEVAAFCEARYGLMTNTGKFYWSAMARPNDIAFYKLCAGLKPDAWQFLALMIAISVDMFNRSSASEKRLTWLVVKSIAGQNVTLDTLGKLWAFMTRRYWGSMQRVMIAYDGEYHLFGRYMPE